MKDNYYSRDLRFFTFSVPSSFLSAAVQAQIANGTDKVTVCHSGEGPVGISSSTPGRLNMHPWAYTASNKKQWSLRFTSGRPLQTLQDKRGAVLQVNWFLISPCMHL